jgi:ParB family chromosome partitioning protein
MAKLQRIPAYIRVANDEQMLELALIENIHRKELNALEIAISYQRLLDECKLTQEKLSEKIGKNRSTIANFLRLLKLPVSVQVALRDGFISMGHARALITIDDSVVQEKLVQQVISKGLNVRQIEELARKVSVIKNVSGSGSPQSTGVPEKYRETPAVLGQRFGTKVSLRRNNNGRGSIVITFKNDEELDKIISIIKN